MISPTEQVAMRGALARLKSAAELAEKSKTELRSSWTSAVSSLLGNESSVEASVSNAEATITGYRVLSGKIEKLIADPKAGTVEARDFIRSVGVFTDVAAILATVKETKASTVAATVAKDTAKDILSGAKTAARMGFPAITATALLGVALVIAYLAKMFRPAGAR